MATIGSITVAFKTDFGDLEKGLDEATELFEALKEAADEVSESIEAVEKSKIEISTAVDRSEIDSVTDEISSSSATMAVETVVDTAQLDEVTEDIDNRQQARIEIKIDILAVEKIVEIIDGFVDKVKESLQELAKSILEDVKGSALKFLGPLGAAFKVASVFTGQYKQELQAVATETKNLINLAERFDVTYQAMELLEASAARAGVSMALLAKAQTSLIKNISKIAYGQIDSEAVREAAVSLVRLGLSAKELRRLSPEEQFRVIAAELAKVADAGDRAAIAYDLFGKTGMNVLPALKGLEEVRKDAERFGATISNIDLSRLKDLDKSFDRLKLAANAFSGALLTPLVPLQTGWNNFVADVSGGLNKLFGPLATLAASALVGFQVFFEVVGRGINIILRLGGAIAEAATGFANAPLLAVGWQALGSALMDVLAVAERLVSIVEAVASAIATSLTPSAEALKDQVDITAPAESVSTWFEKLLVAAKYLGIVVLALAVTEAAVVSFGVTSSGTSILVTAYNAVTSISFSGLAAAAIAAFRAMTVGVVQMAATYVASMILIGVTTIASFLTPFLAAVVSFVTGCSTMAATATVSGYAIAAAWVVATLGIAAIVVAIITVINNFDELYEYFANFGENSRRLFTLEGLKEVAGAIIGALWKTFTDFATGLLGFFGNIALGIADALMGIEAPPDVGDAAKASAEDIAAARKKVQEQEIERQKRLNAVMGTTARLALAVASGGASEMTDAGASLQSSFADADVGSAADETARVEEALAKTRSEMNAAIVDAADFGDVAADSAAEAQKEFAKLQERFASGTLSPEQYEDEAKRIREGLEKEIQALDVLTQDDIFGFAKAASEASKDALKEIEKIGRGQDLGSTFSADRFFPTSDEIKQAASDAQKQFEARNKEIAQKLAAGEFGEGRAAKEAAERAFTESKEQFQRDVGKIEADISFASDIRKALEDAFLTPADLFERRLEEIANNKSLTDIEKQQAKALEAQQFVESQFGKTAGQGFSERAAAIDVAAAAGGFAPGREEVERRKLSIERRQAAGLDVSAGDQLAAGVDNINDVFGVTGKTLEEIQATLSPSEFADYQEAIKKNRDAIRESVGVEKTGAEKLAESRQKLDEALDAGIINAEERDKAIKKQRDALLSSLGISKSPAEEFEDAVERIRENASALSPDEIAKGLKEAKDKLLSSLGIDKSPADVAAESLTKLNEAFRKGQISQEEFAKGAQKARDTLLQSLGIPLDPVNALRERMDNLREAVSRGLITQEEFTKGQEEARRSMLPGSEAKSPVQQFREDFDAVSRAVEQGLISDEEGDARKLNLQAELQETLKPALDNVAQDRRQVGSADSRSSAGVDTFFRILQGRDNPSLKAQLEIARNTRLLAEAQQDPDAAPVIAQLGAR